MAISGEHEHINNILQRAVLGVFERRGWTSLDAAEIATGISASTINRMKRGMSVKPDSVMEFGVAVGEPREVWGLYALGLEPKDVSDAVAVLPPETVALLEYIEDPETRAAVKYFHGLPPALRGPALASLAGMAKYRDAGEIARELEEEATVGKRADRRERPSSKPSS